MKTKLIDQIYHSRYYKFRNSSENKWYIAKYFYKDSFRYDIRVPYSSSKSAKTNSKKYRLQALGTVVNLLFVVLICLSPSFCKSFSDSSSHPSPEEKQQGKYQEKTKQQTKEAKQKPPIAQQEDQDIGVIVNQGIYRVGKQIITQEDLKNMVNRLRNMKTKGDLEKKAIDTLIERSLVFAVAEEEAIIVTDERIENEIARQSQFQGISKAQFRKKIEKELSLPFEEWSKELRYKLIKRQLAQLHLRIPPPSEDEIKRFYRKNRKRIGLEFRYREMVFIPQNGSVAEERRISQTAQSIADKLQAAPKSFANLAKTSPHNNSRYKYRGGLRFYQSIHEIATRNRILATVLFSHSKGEISRPFRDSLNRYVIVKVENKRFIPLKKVRHLILAQLYGKKEDAAFSKWIQKKRKGTAIVSLTKK